MPKKSLIADLIKQVLDGTDIDMGLDTYTLQETLEIGRLNIKCEVHHQKTGQKRTIVGEGVGIIDAFFRGFVEIYSQEFPSLNTIRFTEFTVNASIDNETKTNNSDSLASVHLGVANSDGYIFEFTHASRSMTRSCLEVVLAAGEFFVNSERAFIAVYRALQHARETNRSDSVRIYTQQLTTLVKATSYSQVIEKIRQEELGRAT